MNPLAVLAGADVGTVGALGSLNTVGRTIARAAQIHPKSCFFFFFREEGLPRLDGSTEQHLG